MSYECEINCRRHCANSTQTQLSMNIDDIDNSGIYFSIFRGLLCDCG
jgi:hypothetical protein